MIRNKKGQGMTMETVAKGLLMIMVLLVLVFFLFRSTSLGNKISSCETTGAVLIEGICDGEVSEDVSFIKTKDGQSCCKKKIGISNNRYKAWKNTADIVGETKTSSSGSSTTLDSPGSVTLITRRTKDAGDDKAHEKDKIYFFFQQKPYEGEVLEFRQGDNFVTRGFHTFDKGTYCKLAIYEAERSGDGWGAKKIKGVKKPVKVVQSTTCEPQDYALRQLEISSDIDKIGTYIVEYTVKSSQGSDTTLGKPSPAIAVFKVVGSAEETDSVYPKVFVAKTSDSRQGKLYCWIDIDVQNVAKDTEFDKTLSITRALAERNEGDRSDVCTTKEQREKLDYSDVRYFKSDSLNGKNVNIGEELAGNNYCLQISQLYDDTSKTERSWDVFKEYSFEECDFVSVYKPEQLMSDSEKESSSGAICQTSCEEYNKDVCNQFESRDSTCKFGLDCYLKGGPANPKQNCKRCDSSILTCADYKTQGTCVENDCLQNMRCDWVGSKLAGGCKEIKI